MSTTHTDGLREGAILEARMSAAYKDGLDTATLGEARVNPWNGDAISAVERVLSRMWAKGYLNGNPVPPPPA